MTQKSISQQHAATSDYVVDGLLYGLVAGVLMAGYLVIYTVATGNNAADLLAGFSITDNSPVTGSLLHLAMAGIYGLAFGLINGFITRTLHIRMAWLLGPLYSIVLWGLAGIVIVPATGSVLPDIPGLHFAIAHLVYGIALGLLMQWRSAAQ